MAKFAWKPVPALQTLSRDALPAGIARALDAAAHDRTEDLSDYAKPKQAELEAHIAQESAQL